MAILYGTQSNGETLPVLVDQYGNLIAKGIDGAPGEPGEPGPPGPPGGEFPLPPGATDGALLGWQDGELVWVTAPLPPVVNDKGVRPIIYTGSNEILEVTGVGFKPSLVWIKQRNGAGQHALFSGAERYLVSNTNDLERRNGNTLQTFTDDGFTLGTEDFVNGSSSRNYVAWCWRASDTKVTNNDGTIASQVRSNGDFSIVTYSGNQTDGATVGHGLDSAPKLIILKSTKNAFKWMVYSASLGANQSLTLNTSDRADSSNDYWSGTQPTGAVFSISKAGEVNIAYDPFVAYCWAETPGVSSFGQYSGTGGRFQVSTGFRPSLVIIKSLAVGDWFMFDNARGVQQTLRANEADREDQTGVIELLDDGFQVLFALPGINESNVSYIYAAFANPEDAAFARRQLRRQARQEERQQNETQPR